MEPLHQPVLLEKESAQQEILKEAINTDVRNLMGDFLAHRQHTCVSFTECWKRADFSLIFVARPNEIPYGWFMDCLFDAGLELLNEAVRDSSRPVAIGSVLLLWFLHQSQPGEQRIAVSKRSWSHLVAITELSEGFEEVQKIIGMLKGLGAFKFVAMTASEILAAHGDYCLRLEERQNPKEAASQAEMDLAGLECDLVRASGSLVENSLGIQLAEQGYAQKREVVGDFARTEVSRDLAQNQRDWASTFGAVDSKALRGFTSAKGKGSRRATVQEPYQRSHTAPPVHSVAPPEYLISTEHMPSLF